MNDEWNNPNFYHQVPPTGLRSYTGFQASCTQESTAFPVELLALDFGVYISQIWMAVGPLPWEFAAEGTEQK